MKLYVIAKISCGNRNVCKQQGIYSSIACKQLSFASKGIVCEFRNKSLLHREPRPFLMHNMSL